MFEWRLLTKDKKDEIIKEWMKQDEEMDFKEYARRKRDIFFTEDDIELYLYDFDEKRATKEDYDKLLKVLEEMKQYKVEPKKYNSQGIPDKNGVYEYKNGVLKPIEEKPKEIKPKRVKLSEMSDAELKEYYKKKEEEKERRKRLQEEIKREEYAAECRELEEELDKMSYKEIEEKYWKKGKYIRTGIYSGYVEQRFIYYDEKGKEDKQKSDIIRNAYESKEEIKAYRKQQEEIMKKETEQDRQYSIEEHKDNINENRAVLIFIIGVFIFIFMVATNFEDVGSIVVGGIICGFWIIMTLLIGKEQIDSQKREIEELETHKQ